MANKKKYEYVKEHILTIENLRSLIGLFFLGLILLGISAFSWYNIAIGDCCKGTNACDFASGLGMLIWVVVTFIFSAGGLACVCGIFIDDGGKEIKVRTEI